MAARRAFLKQSSLLGIGVLVSSINQYTFFLKKNVTYPSLRVPVSARRFYSQAAENTLKEYQKNISAPCWRQCFDYCFPHTLDEHVSFELIGKFPDTVILSGNTMDLEESTLQIWNYIPICKADRKLALLIEGLLRHQWKMIDETTSIGAKFVSSVLCQSPRALCFPLQLAHRYWNDGVNKQVFDNSWIHSLQQTLAVFQANIFDSGQQHQFIRFNGLIGSAAGSGHFDIALNLLVAGTLETISSMLVDLSVEPAKIMKCQSVAAGIRKAIRQTSIFSMPGFGAVYASETALSGNTVCMERAEMQSLLALPLLNPGFAKDPVYRNTRTYTLSLENPLTVRQHPGELPTAAFLVKYLLEARTSGYQDNLHDTMGKLGYLLQETSVRMLKEGYLHSLSADLILYCQQRDPGLLSHRYRFLPAGS